jgi:hypothetical protein
MTQDEKIKALADLKQIRYEIDQLHSEGFTKFVEAVHSLSLMLNPLVQQQQALAYKLIELEKKFREEIGE